MQSSDRNPTPAGWIILLAVALRVAFVFATPAWQSPDEYPHFWYVKQLAEHLRFPHVSGEFPGYEAFQPPLYYAAAAPLLAVFPEVQEFSYDRIARPNVALVVVRMVSVLFGIIVVYATWQAGVFLFPDDPWTALGATLFVALLPTFVGVGSSVNNDSAVAAFSSLSCLFMLR
jgi:4-amino-4-deoxy-L-arabinose transferase-like glycosyltransferase